MTDEGWHRRRNVGGMAIGLVLMLLGVAILLDQTGVIDAFPFVSFWPVAVICIGLVKLSNVGRNGRRHGWWWVFFGVWLLLNEMHVLRARESWPLFLVAIGISMVWRDATRRPRCRERVE